MKFGYIQNTPFFGWSFNWAALIVAIIVSLIIFVIYYNRLKALENDYKFCFYKINEMSIIILSLLVFVSVFILLCFIL